MDQMQIIKLRDALNNSGLPQIAEKLTLNDIKKIDLKAIHEKIKENDGYYRQGWIDSRDRKLLKEFLNSYCEVFRCYSLIIE